MRLIRLAVEDFGCIRSANIEFGEGLNILYGPNDLGKSSLAEAIRAVLLMQHGSSSHEPYVRWRTDRSPSVELVFQTEPQRIWRLSKTFGSGSVGSSVFEFSPDGVSFTTEASGRRVDAEVRKLLKWGIPEPGGKGGRRGIHESFLTTVLLAQQQDVTSVFRSDLGADGDKSGRDRLTAALQAIAQDPLFTKVLTATQGKVDEAFTSTGKKKRSRVSPFTAIAEEVRKAAEEEAALESALEESNCAREQVERLVDGRLRQEERVENAKNLLSKLKLAVEKMAEAKRAREKLEEIEDLIRRVSDTEQEESNLRRELVELEKKQQDANAKVDTARKSSQEAERALDELTSSSGVDKRKLELELETKRLNLEREKKELSEKEVALAGIQKIVDEAADLDHKISLGTKNLVQKRDELDSAIEQSKESETNVRLLRAIRDWLELGDVNSQLERMEQAFERAKLARTALRQKRQEVNALKAKDLERQLPDDDTLSQLEDLQNRLQVAEGAAEVGLSLVIKPELPFEARLSHDGETPKTIAITQESEFQANREMRVEIEGMGSFALTGGTADSRERLAALRQEWDSRTQPLMAAAKAVSIEEMRQAMRDRDVHERDLHQLEREIETLESDVSAVGDGGDVKIERLRAQRAALEEALRPFDRDVLEKQGTSIGSSSRAELRSLGEKAGEELEKANRRAGELNVEIVREETQLQSVTSKRDEAIGRRDGVLEEYGADWSTKLEMVRADLSRISVEEHSVVETLQALTEGQTDQLEDAKRRAEEAERLVTETEEESALVEQDLAALRTRLGACQGRLQERRAAADNEDEAGARLSYSRLQQELMALEDEARNAGHVGPIDSDALEIAKKQFEKEQSALGQTQRELAEAKGRLSQTGGDVARERLEDARLRYKRLRDRERELETEYGAWKLLLDTLHEAEKDLATHLGESIVGPISQRFQALTGERYGQFELGPNLETAGIEAAGNQRKVDSLSVGTQEQLATIFRLSLAEQLKSVLVLDDQLAQTDAARMKWFREKLEESANNIQIVVFTCRPEDYLGEAYTALLDAVPRNGIHAFDLAQALERAS